MMLDIICPFCQARDIVNELGFKFSDDLPLSELSQPMQMHLQNVIKKMTWPHPDGAALSPAGEYNLYVCMCNLVLIAPLQW